MLGEQVEAADEIKKIDHQLGDIDSENAKLAKKIEELSSGEKSPQELDKEARNAAIEGGWKSRAEAVDGKKPNITDKRWNEIRSAVPDQPREALEKQFNEKLADYKKASEAGDDHLHELLPLEASLYDETRILELLAQRV